MNHIIRPARQLARPRYEIVDGEFKVHRVVTIERLTLLIALLSLMLATGILLVAYALLLRGG